DSIKVAGRQLDFREDKTFYYYDYSLIANRVGFVQKGTEGVKSVEVFYAGKFNPSAARSPSDYMRIDSDGVFLRSYGYSLWFPIFLEPAAPSHAVNFPEATFRYPVGFQCVFVGNRESVDHDDGDVISTWSAQGIDLMDYQCTVQRWKTLTEGWLSVYYLPDSVSSMKARAILEFTTSFNERCDRRFMKNKLPQQGHIAEMPEFGDIASANMTGISERLWRSFGDDSHSKETFAHEIVHAYVQIPIEQADPLCAFVMEGFPSCFDDLVLSEYVGDDWLRKLLADHERSYLSKKATGLDRYGKKLPPDKPLDQISFDEIGDYKDNFMLTSRTSLFFNFLRVRMGENRYSEFERDLFDCARISNERFRDIVLKHLPGSEEDLTLWLSSVEYPDRFRLENLR
ncbi:MAG: hypothetical protein JSU65_03160, partial [Candidatus Zixiibacteriota bacterium]